MQNNATLCPLVFDEHNLIYDYVRQGLLNLSLIHIYQHQQQAAVKLFLNISGNRLTFLLFRHDIPCIKFVSLTIKL